MAQRGQVLRRLAPCGLRPGDISVGRLNTRRTGHGSEARVLQAPALPYVGRPRPRLGSRTTRSRQRSARWRGVMGCGTSTRVCIASGVLPQGRRTLFNGKAAAGACGGTASRSRAASIAPTPSGIIAPSGAAVGGNSGGRANDPRSRRGPIL